MVLATSQQEFSDADFRIVDNADQSKKAAFEASGIATATTRIMFQVEFVGFSRLGSSVLQPLRQNIPRYELLRDPNVPAPSRFSNYD